MLVYVVLGYDEDYYTFEVFEGIFNTRKMAIEYMEQDYNEYDDCGCPPQMIKAYNHTEYAIVTYDVSNSVELRREWFTDVEGTLESR